MLTNGTVAMIAVTDLEALLDEHPRLMRVLWAESLFDGSVQREWIVNVGRRSGPARLAHLLCEFGLRQEQVGIAKRNTFELPLTQTHLADCVGLTSVHVNRMLRVLGEEGLIEREHRRMTIRDWEGLVRFAGFDPNYLTAPAAKADS